MTYTISSNQPPRAGGDICYWERTQDPFQEDALEQVKFGLPGLSSIAVFIGGKMNQGKRKEGWMAIDWIENPVGFIADGEEYDGEPQSFVFAVGPYGHLCAYTTDDHGEERLAEHRKWIERNANEARSLRG